jgi:hypothetical protein
MRLRGIVLCALAMVTALPAAVSAADEVEPRLIRIGPQITLIESDDGKLRMFDEDPSQQAPKCEGPCWMNWVQLVAGVAIIAPRNITQSSDKAHNLLR